MESGEVRIVELPAMRVAAALGFGTEPEQQALDTIQRWAQNCGVAIGAGGLRLFGFDNPSPSAGSPNYGYEVWLTAPAGAESGEGVAIKEFEGGLYAVAGCRQITEPWVQIPERWKELRAWLANSPYHLGRHQWLEEHLHPGQAAGGAFDLDLYMPVQK